MPVATSIATLPFTSRQRPATPFAAAFRQRFGLTPHEYDLIRTLPDSARCFLIKRGGESVVVRLDLSGEKDILTILSGRERSVRLLDDIRASVGDEPADWLPSLLEQA
mgnify:CR=1 FL=1